MNLGVVTINLPRIAIQSEGSKERFWSLLNERMRLAGEALEFKVKRCREAVPENAPILFMNGAFGKRLKPTDSVDEVFKNKRATISMGYIGLYEVATILFGSEWENNSEAKEFTVGILRRMKAYCDKLGDEQGYHYSVYATPSENLTDRFCQLDLKKFGNIPNVTDKEYYTNSFHYDVRKKPTPFEKIDFEMDYLPYTSGGQIFYAEYPVMHHNLEALESVWDYAYDRIGYWGTNTPIDECFRCGFKGEFDTTDEGFECPECKNNDPLECDVCRRTCGYLGNPQARPMVHGRHKEICARTKHIDGTTNEANLDG